jgi:iron complex transport system substrate-binding protein
VTALTRRGRAPELAQLASSGAHLVDVRAPDNDNFLRVSWERIADYPADVIMYDARTPRPSTIATWNALPAVRAGQVHPWYPAAPYSYRAYGPIYSEIAGWLGTSKVLPA